MKRYVHFPKVEGQASRQAHADLPAGTYEREISKEGFFGPAAHLYHRHPPTGWVELRRPAAAACVRLHEARGHAGLARGTRAELLHNAVGARALLDASPRSMPQLARNADGDELLFVHAGSGELFCDYGHLAFEAGDYVLIPRGTMWRVECAQPLRALLIEATNNSLPPARQGPGRPARDLRRGDARHAAHRRRVQGSAGRAASGASPSSGAARCPPSPIRSIRSMRWAGTAISRWCASTCATCARS